MIELDEQAIRARLRPLADDARFRRAIANVTGDRLLLSLFLMGLSHGEGLGQAGVAAIGQEEIARLMRPAPAEQGHVEETRLAAEALFPEFFDHGQYRYEDHVVGRDYYFTVREANRRRLREGGRHSPLNLHLTTSFGWGIVAELLGDAMVEALARSPLPEPVRERVGGVVGTILRREATHLGALAQHNALLAADRRALSPAARDTLELLARLTVADYEWAADLAVRELVAAWLPYADAAAVRTRLGAAARNH